MPVTNRTTKGFIDPFRQYNFMLELGGGIEAGFQEVSGIDATTDVIEYREGSQNMTVRKMPGLTKFSNVTLKRGITLTESKALWTWMKQVMDGQGGGSTSVDRRNITISLYDDAGEKKVTWELVDAWPVKYTGPDFNATGNAVAIESLEIAHEGVKAYE
ncbi:MAG: phage tail protein [Chloroflexota bacterium]